MFWKREAALNYKLEKKVFFASVLMLAATSKSVCGADVEFATLSSGNKVKVQRITKQPEADASAYTILYESKQSTAAEQKREKDEVWKWVQPQAEKQSYKLVRIKAMISQKFNYPSGPLHGVSGMYIRDYAFQKDKTGWHEIVETK